MHIPALAIVSTRFYARLGVFGVLFLSASRLLLPTRASSINRDLWL